MQKLSGISSAKDGEEGLGLVHSRPGLELAAVASNGAGGGLTAAQPGQEGGAPLYGRPGSSSATTRPSAASMGVRAGLGRSEWQGRQGTDRWSVGRSRPDGARHEEGVDSEAASVGAWPGEGRPRDAGGPDAEARYGARGAARCRAGLENISQCPCLNASNSKKLNRSAPNNE
jgi:hypothetical protein